MANGIPSRTAVSIVSRVIVVGECASVDPGIHVVEARHRRVTGCAFGNENEGRPSFANLLRQGYGGREATAGRRAKCGGQSVNLHMHLHIHFNLHAGEFCRAGASPAGIVDRRDERGSLSSPWERGRGRGRARRTRRTPIPGSPRAIHHPRFASTCYRLSCRLLRICLIRAGSRLAGYKRKKTTSSPSTV